MQKLLVLDLEFEAELEQDAIYGDLKARAIADGWSTIRPRPDPLPRVAKTKYTTVYVPSMRNRRECCTGSTPK